MLPLRRFRPAAAAFTVALLVSSAPGLAPAPSDSPEKIVFTSMSDEGKKIGIFTMNADGTQRATLTKEGSLELDPALSPDGKHIVFAVTDKKDMKGEIWVMNADGTGRKRLVEGKAKAMAVTPSWSPDGKQIAYTLMKVEAGPPGDTEMLLMDADGKNDKHLAKGMMPSWSPDGKQILYTILDKAGGFEPRLWVMDADGKNAKQLQDKPSMMGAFSPDGKRIAFMGADSSNADHPPAIKLCDADGSNTVQATKVTSGFEMAPRWSADGKRILFCRMAAPKDGPPKKATILVMDADGGNEKALTKGDSMDLLGGAGLFMMETRGESRPSKP